MMKKSIASLSLLLLIGAPLNAGVATVGKKALATGISIAENKKVQCIAAVVTFFAFYRTLSKGPQQELSEEDQQRKSKSTIDSMLTYIDKTILGSPGDANKGIEATGFLGNVVANWKAIVAPLLLLDQVQKNGPTIIAFLKDMARSEAVEKVATVAVKAA